MSEASRPSGAAGIREGADRGVRDVSPPSTNRNLRFSSASSASCMSIPRRFLSSCCALGLLLGVSVNPSRFTAASNVSTILTQVMVTGILGIGQTLVILTAGIDLSIGVIMVISSVVMGRLGVIDGVPTILAFPLGLVCGSAFGLLNGALVTRLRMPPFIVTLGTLSIIGALNTFYSQSETIGMQDIDDKSPFLSMMGNTLGRSPARRSCGARSSCCSSPPSCWYILNRTAYGRHVYATGDDPEVRSARRHRHRSRSAQRLYCGRASSQQSPAGR